MKKSEFKKLVKPIIEECIKEVLLEGKILSNIISETMKGLNRNIPSSAIQESTQIPSSTEPSLKKQNLAELSKNMYNGVNVFEGLNVSNKNYVHPNATVDKVSEGSSLPPLGMDPNDAGIDISMFFGK